MKNVNCYFDDSGMPLKDIVYEFLSNIVILGDNDDI